MQASIEDIDAFLLKFGIVKHLIDSSTRTIAIIAGDRIAYANHVMQEFLASLGKGKGDWRGLVISELLRQSDQSKWHVLLESLNRGEQFLAPLEVVLAGQADVTMEITVIPFHADTKLAIILNLHNVSARVHAEKTAAHYKQDMKSQLAKAGDAYDSSEIRLLAIINTATDAIITIDSEQRIAMMNPAAELMFGFAAEALKGQSLNILIPSRFHHSHGSHVQTFGKTGSTSRRMGKAAIDVVGIRSNGEEFPVDASISHSTDHGSVFYTVILRDISIQKRTESDLRASQQELRALSENLQIIREEERKRISRELHDDLGQRLAALRNDFTLLRKQIHSDPQLIESTSNIDQLLVDAIASLRRISADLRPRPLDDLGLVEAIKLFIVDFSKRHRIACNLNVLDVNPIIDSSISAVIYRMIQEALNNVAKHASATKVDIELRSTEDSILLTIVDDGVGMPEARARKVGSFGLIGMRERATAASGTFTISSNPGKGVTIVVSLPIR